MVDAFSIQDKALPLFRDHVPKVNPPPLTRRFTAAGGAFLVQLLLLLVLLTVRTESDTQGIATAPAIRWLYLPPVMEDAVEAVPEVEPEITLETPPPAPPITLPEPPENPYLSPQELEFVSLPPLNVPPTGGSARFFGALNAYLACNLENYAALSNAQKAVCDARLASLQQERDLLDPEKLPFMLTAREQQQWQQFAREAGERQAPLLLPCLNENGVAAITVGTVECILSGLSDGFDPANNPTERYAPEP